MKEIRLFDYQEEMRSRIEQAWCLHRSVMVQMPTGTGKTVLLASVVGEFLRENMQEGVWIVTHRRELVSQVRDTVRMFFPDDQRARIRVMSIQWLSRHYGEMAHEPGLIVVDEAHHAVAETYAEVLNACPKARRLGLTATPYRMSGQGFADLFDVLLTSWSMERFIAEGRLSTYDYYSIKPDSQDQRLIDSLQKRGADGDYQQRELNEVMDVRPSLERLCLTVKEYVPGKKGIVYAISIQHAGHIAEYYREHGIRAVAVSSLTPLAERKELIERFKSSSLSSSLKSKENISPSAPSLLHKDFSKITPSLFTLKEGSTSVPKPLSPQGTGDATAPPRRPEPLRSKVGVPSMVSPDCVCGVNRLAENTDERNHTDDAIEVLVSVDLFSEGFDCPDVEFIQLARPTLSLSKYLQMVGRGLRVSQGKEYCVILDNVGLYRRFGLPSAEHDWQGCFSGRGEHAGALQRACMRLYSENSRLDYLSLGDDKATMTRIVRHETQRLPKDAYQVCAGDSGLLGVRDSAGKWVLECQFQHVRLTEDGFACCYNQRMGQSPWVDLSSGLCFHSRPQAVTLMGIEFCSEDGRRLFPRIRSRLLDDQSWLTVKTLALQVGCGLSWKRRFIPWDEPGKVYQLAGEVKGTGMRLYRDEEGRHYAQADLGQPLRPVASQAELDHFRAQCVEAGTRWLNHWRKAGPRNMSLLLYTQEDRLRYFDEFTPLGDGLYYIRRKGERVRKDTPMEFWLDSLTNTVHYQRPWLFRRGYVRMLREGEVFFVRNIGAVVGVPLKNWQVRADGNICVIDDCLFLRERPRESYLVLRRSSDFSYFLVSPNYDCGRAHEGQNLRVTQFQDGQVACTWVPGDAP